MTEQQREDMALFTLPETAEILRVSQTTLRRFLKAGEIDCIVINKGKRKFTYRFSRENINEFINKRVTNLNINKEQDG